MTRVSENADVLIVGSGLAGATASCALARIGIKVVVLESEQKPEWNSRKYDLRASALNIASQNTLSNIGAWSKIKSMRMSQFDAIDVWDENSGGRIHFEGNDAGLDYLGHIVENSATLSALHGVLYQNKVGVHYGASINRVFHEKDYIFVTTNDKKTFRAKLLVGADGSNSRVRDLSDISIHKKPYRQKAIVAQVGTEKKNRKTAYQKFLSSGPLAFLPLSDYQSLIVWSTDEKTSDELMHLPDLMFEQKLSDVFDHKLGIVKLLSHRKRFSVTSGQASTYIKNRIALIGDAAHMVHPLAGLGANQGIMDAAALAEIVNISSNNSSDIGNRASLRRYERWRRTENQLISSTVDAIFHCFSTTDSTISNLRYFGLNLTDNLKPIKSLFVKQATGISGKLPEISRFSHRS